MKKLIDFAYRHKLLIFIAVIVALAVFVDIRALFASVLYLLFGLKGKNSGVSSPQDAHAEIQQHEYDEATDDIRQADAAQEIARQAAEEITDRPLKPGRQRKTIKL